ncbi:hypothetical protein WJX74_003462 [Apatococcus lobatus]|uniref:Diphthine--ammonia ligase n=1 Tax=Apatococcus lobatus TaxID=904363 RepID=A0AAW1RD53_9CHLO
MRVLALVSGGKDSCYAAQLCQTHGHTVVALGNLLPSDNQVDELDSHMYQTVGHQVLQAYATCMGLPLYRRRIHGTSLQKELAYLATGGDEVEDLVALLAYVLQLQPEVQAVASGAIASDYQRTRVEHACSRLGLVSLAPMWRQPQAQLLQAMIDSGIHAILVKVAAIGLDPHRHLGKDLASVQPHLHKLNRLYGSNICGEGGEYETLAVGGPLFRHASILLDQWDVRLHSQDSVAPVGVLHPISFHLKPNTAGAASGNAAASLTASGPDMRLARHGTCSIKAPDQGQSDVITVPPDFWAEAQPAKQGIQVPPFRLFIRMRRQGGFIHVACSPHLSQKPVSEADSHHEQEPTNDTAWAVDTALGSISTALEECGSNLGQALFVHMFLADMAAFGEANAAYNPHMPAVNPPARACVQTYLPSETPVAIDVLVPCNPEGRRALHVQSISSWAPACIGPYSQATSHQDILFMAGQLGLDPISMALTQPPSSSEPSDDQAAVSDASSSRAYEHARAEAQRCLTSCQAVAIAMGCDLPQGLLAATTFVASAAASSPAPASTAPALSRPAAYDPVASPPAPTALAAVSRSAAPCAASETHSSDATASAVTVVAAVPTACHPCRAKAHHMGGADEQQDGAESARSGDHHNEGQRHAAAAANAMHSFLSTTSPANMDHLSDDDEEKLDGFWDLPPEPHLTPPAMARHWDPLQLYIAVPGLPKQARVEIQPIACTPAANCPSPPASDTDEEPASSLPRGLASAHHPADSSNDSGINESGPVMWGSAVAKIAELNGLAPPLATNFQLGKDVVSKPSIKGWPGRLRNISMQAAMLLQSRQSPTANPPLQQSGLVAPSPMAQGSRLEDAPVLYDASILQQVLEAAPQQSHAAPLSQPGGDPLPSNSPITPNGDGLRDWDALSSLADCSVKVSGLISPGRLCLMHAAVDGPANDSRISNPAPSNPAAANQAAPSSISGPSLDLQAHSNISSRNAKQLCEKAIRGSHSFAIEAGHATKQQQQRVIDQEGEQSVSQQQSMQLGSQGVAQSSHMKAASEVLVAGIGQCLQHAGLSWQDCVSIRAFIPQQQSSRVDLHHALPTAQPTGDAHAHVDCHGKEEPHPDMRTKPSKEERLPLAQDQESVAAIDNDICQDMGPLKLTATHAPGNAQPKHGEQDERYQEQDEQALSFRNSWETALSGCLGRARAEATIAFVGAAGMDDRMSAVLCLQVHACKLMPS